VCQFVKVIHSISCSCGKFSFVVVVSNSVLPLEENTEFFGNNNIDLDSDDSDGFASEDNVCIVYSV
jgi:hypothetical protein